MKILFLIDKLNIGGAQKMVVEQSSKLNAQICTLSEEDKESFHVFVKKTLIPLRYDPRSWIKLIRFIKKGEFDVVISHLYKANVAGRICSYLAGVKSVTFEHNVYIKRGKWERFVNRILSPLTHKIIAVSPAVKDYLMEHEGIPEHKIEVIFNGADFRILKESKPVGKVVLSVGRIVKQKNYEELIEVAKKLPEFTFQIAGKGDVDEWNAKSGDNVHFLGVRHDIPELLQKASVFFMPSHWEGFSIALIEAAASGKPLVTSDLESFNGMVKSGWNGYRGDYVSSLKKAMKHKESLGKHSIEMSKQFSIESNINNLLKVI